MKKKKLLILVLISLIVLGLIVGFNYPKISFYRNVGKTLASETAGTFELRLEKVELDQSLGELAEIPLLTTNTIGPFSIDGHYFFDSQASNAGLAIVPPSWLSAEDIQVLLADQKVYLSLDNLALLTKYSTTDLANNLASLIAGKQAENPYQGKFVQLASQQQSAQGDPKKLVSYLLRLPVKKFISESGGQRLRLNKVDSEKLVNYLSTNDEQSVLAFFDSLDDCRIEIYVDKEMASCQLVIEAEFSQSVNHVKSLGLTITLEPNKESQRTITVPSEADLITADELKKKLPLLNAN